MELKDILVIIISGLGLVVSVIALIRDFYTRKKVQELTNLEIEKLKAEKEKLSKAIVSGFIEDGCFVIDNSGEAVASNIRYEGWDDMNQNISKKIKKTLEARQRQIIVLKKLTAAPPSSYFKIIWDDKSGKDHVWSDILDLE